jgi:hypothetical protein
MFEGTPILYAKGILPAIHQAIETATFVSARVLALIAAFKVSDGRTPKSLR